MSQYLRTPILPINVKSKVLDLLREMGKGAFQGRALSQALEIWKEMLKEGVFIFLGLAGAMVPAGMRGLIAFLIKKRLINCLVSTGANLFHDLHETLGNFHWQGSAQVDDLQLKAEGIDRIYDVFALEEEFRGVDKYLLNFSKTLERNRAYSTREFFHLLGKRLVEEGRIEGILTASWESSLPIYCPAIGDSSIGIALALEEGGKTLLFDTLADIKEIATLVIEVESTGVIYIGGGTPKNFIQQTEITAAKMGKDMKGHRYAIQITTDSPHFGGLSGCTLEEAQSWGKIAPEAKKVTVYCDSTIAFPLLFAGIAEAQQILAEDLP